MQNEDRHNANGLRAGRATAPADPDTAAPVRAQAHADVHRAAEAGGLLAQTVTALTTRGAWPADPHLRQAAPDAVAAAQDRVTAARRALNALDYRHGDRASRHCARRLRGGRHAAHTHLPRLREATQDAAARRRRGRY